MGTNYNNETGYEALLKDFRRYQKQTPKGVSLQNKRNKTIVLKFKINDKPKSKGCNCTFTLDGMVEALAKANKVAEALKTIANQIEFDTWYDKEILGTNNIEDNRITFTEAIKKVEDDFWSRPDRRKQPRDKNNPSHVQSWNATYGNFYKHLPHNKELNYSDIKQFLDSKDRESGSFSDAVSAMKKLCRMNKRKSILEELEDITIVQTKFLDLQNVSLEQFLKWRSDTLGITQSLHPNSSLDVRKAWLWVFSMQVTYALRISEVFAIKNLFESYTTKDGVTIPALSNINNTNNLIYIGDKTAIGTTVKTGSRIATPLIPPKYPNLIELLDVKTPLIPANKPKSTNVGTLQKFYPKEARKKCLKWNAPFTQTHGLRHLGNINGMQAGIPLEVRAQSMGHTPAMNDGTYKKRQSTQTTIDLLTNSNSNAIDFVTALAEAKKLVAEDESNKDIIVRMMSIIYQKDSKTISELI